MLSTIYAIGFVITFALFIGCEIASRREPGNPASLEWTEDLLLAVVITLAAVFWMIVLPVFVTCVVMVMRAQRGQ